MVTQLLQALTGGGSMDIDWLESNLEEYKLDAYDVVSRAKSWTSDFDINTLIDAMFLVLLEEHDIEQEPEDESYKVEIFCNCIDSHLNFEIDGEWTEIYDLNDLEKVKEKIEKKRTLSFDE